MTAPIVGMTGGIACGKSTVAKAFLARGVPVVDADDVARDVVAMGSDGLAAIVARFGEEILDGTGALDRDKLGARVFADDEARRDLGRITHPLIAAESGRRLAALAERGAPYVVYDAALLVENGLAGMFAALVVVACDEATQRARLMRRNGFDEAEATRRIRAQMPLSEKVAVADFVIDNGGTMDALEREVARVDDALRERFRLGANG